MTNYPYHIIVSTAHTEHGQDSNAEKENTLSEWVSDRVVQLLDEAGISCEAVEIWADKKEDDYSSLQYKVQEINRISEKQTKPCLALEIHWNDPFAASGSCILHDANSARSALIATEMLPTILKELGRGQHSRGVIPFPSAYKPIALAFLRQTRCASVIVEVDSIKHYDEFEQNDWLMEKTAQAIFKSLKGLHYVNQDS